MTATRCINRLLAMKRSGPALAVLALVSGLGMGMPVRAATTYFGDAGIGYGPEESGTTDAPAAYSVAARGSSASVSLSDLNHGEIEAMVATPGAVVLARGTINYIFQVSGEENVFVPVHVQAHGYAEGSGSFSGTSIFKLDYSAPDDYPYYSQLAGSASVYGYGPSHTLNYDEFELDEWVMMLSNSSSFVEMYADAYADYYAGPGGTAHAFLDPIFTIDPAFADRFTITGLPGEASPAGAVPEPANWAMMVAGFGMMGAAMRRRRRRTFRCASA